MGQKLIQLTYRRRKNRGGDTHDNNHHDDDDDSDIHAATALRQPRSTTMTRIGRASATATSSTIPRGCGRANPCGKRVIVIKT